MIGQAELSRLALKGGVTDRAQEKDYVLTWLLAARAACGPETLVFKGGTALRLCYFRDYRYSEDLDFTSDVAMDRGAIVAILEGWFEWIGDQAGITARLATRSGGDHSLYAEYVGPLRAEDGRAVKIDVSSDEQERTASRSLPILSAYSDLDGDAYTVSVYSLIEIWAEKTRSLIQRSQPRDIYDLDHLLAEDRDLPAVARGLFLRKTRSKGIDPSTLFAKLAERERKFEALWQTSLSSHVSELEPFDGAWRRVLRGFREGGY